MKQMLETVTEFWYSSGMDAAAASMAGAWTAALASCALTVLIYAVLSRVAGPVIDRIAQHTPTKIDDILLRRAFTRWIWWLIAVGVLQYTLPEALRGQYPRVAGWLDTVIDVALIGLGTKAAVELLKGIFLIIFDKERVEVEAERLRQAQEEDMDYEYVPSHSLKGLQQMLCVVIICVGVILMVAQLLGKNPIFIISGLGAGAAVLMLVFQDSILGVVAGIQLTANNMLRPGDWIMAPKYGANGRVQEVTLATVKVLNWDHTIITIPPYKLISDSFQNWRKMEETGGRRVMRAFNIDMTTVRFLNDDEAARLQGEPWAEGIDWAQRQVNLSVFRHYLEWYVRGLSTLRPQMLHMVRELAPTPEGLPIEIYFFTKETTWARYEAVQAQALDHILAVVADFGLKIFQSPTGADIRQCQKSQAVTI